ncbi:Cd(II)/Pb(II)-responsive transcriptional regulator [Vibrio natriegens]|uniref:Cd(II)/Pb(II)-responsive transcriptional regulator n=1 Tax=Vibrio natriegens TaxID=691 RepID=UPI003054E9D5|nr:Cd(II)/Pb(II)-responsive transcriptional regulator [Vibrio parahaemolyticus]
MKIGELAKKADCPVETVRYYEKQGLLPKAQRELENNYRRYDVTHLERLLFIRRCRALDMAHDEIRTLLQAMSSDSTSCSPIDNVIRQHLEHVQDRIKELKLLESELKKLRNECDSRRSPEECGIVEKLNANEKVVSTNRNKSKHLGGVH